LERPSAGFQRDSQKQKYLGWMEGGDCAEEFILDTTVTSGRTVPQDTDSAESPAWMWYRKTVMSMGVGMAVSILRYSLYKDTEPIFVPPRARSLPDEVVAGWHRNLRIARAIRGVTRESLLFGFVAGVYFGGEALSERARGKSDALNTAIGGAASGFILGAASEWGQTRGGTIVAANLNVIAIS